MPINILVLQLNTFFKEFIGAGALCLSTTGPIQFYKSVSSNKVNHVEQINFMIITMTCM